MKLVVTGPRLAICRLEPQAPLPDWAVRGAGLVSVTRTDDELSIVCPEEHVPSDIRAERAWRALRVVGPLAFELTGVLAGLATPLANADIPILAISTWDTDWLLVPEERATDAIRALRDAGHAVD